MCISCLARLYSLCDTCRDIPVTFQFPWPPYKAFAAACLMLTTPTTARHWRSLLHSFCRRWAWECTRLEDPPFVVENGAVPAYHRSQLFVSHELQYAKLGPGLACSAGPRRGSIRPWGSAWAYLPEPGFQGLGIESCGSLSPLWLRGTDLGQTCVWALGQASQLGTTEERQAKPEEHPEAESAQGTGTRRSRNVLRQREEAYGGCRLRSS